MGPVRQRRLVRAVAMPSSTSESDSMMSGLKRAGWICLVLALLLLADRALRSRPGTRARFFEDQRSVVVSVFRDATVPVGNGFCVGLFIVHFRNNSLSDLSELSHFQILIKVYVKLVVSV